MTDTRQRGLERAAAAGDPSAAAGLLQERLRTGALILPRIELAAYCGDPTAIMVVGPQTACPGYDGLLHTTCCRGTTGWLRGLWRWMDLGSVPRWLAYFAMVSAAGPALHVWEQTLRPWRCPHCPRSGGEIANEFARREAPGRAIEHATRYLKDPSEENYRKWVAAWSQSLFYIDGEDAWTPKPRVSESECYERIMASERLAGATVLATVKADLINWALDR